MYLKYNVILSENVLRKKEMPILFMVLKFLAKTSLNPNKSQSTCNGFS